MERAGLTFRIECEPLPEPVYVDRDMWEKVVLNLLSNALKFTFEGGVRVALSADGRFAPADGTGHGHRHSGLRVAAYFRALSPGRRGQGPHHRRNRDRTGAGSRTGKPARRIDHGRERSLQRHHVHGYDSFRDGAFAEGQGQGGWKLRIRPCRGSDAFVAEALRWLSDGAAATAGSTRSAVARDRGRSTGGRPRRASPFGGRQRRHERVREAACLASAIRL